MAPPPPWNTRRTMNWLMVWQTGRIMLTTVNRVMPQAKVAPRPILSDSRVTGKRSMATAEM